MFLDWEQRVSEEIIPILSAMIIASEVLNPINQIASSDWDEKDWEDLSNA